MTANGLTGIKNVLMEFGCFLTDRKPKDSVIYTMWLESPINGDHVHWGMQHTKTTVQKTSRELYSGFHPCTFFSCSLWRINRESHETTNRQRSAEVQN